MVAIYEKEVINKLINHYGDSTEAKKNIAKKLKISTATLYRKLEEMNKKGIWLKLGGIRSLFRKAVFYIKFLYLA